MRRVSGTGGDRIMIRNRFSYDPSMEVSTIDSKVLEDSDKS